MVWKDDVRDVVVLYCTVPNLEVGSSVARVLVQEGLVACVNLIPGL
jgi:uncharacterized protein involved in tolerance to divalent cations